LYGNAGRLEPGLSLETKTPEQWLRRSWDEPRFLSAQLAAQSAAKRHHARTEHPQSARFRNATTTAIEGEIIHHEEAFGADDATEN
jgi:hypothetical protein